MDGVSMNKRFLLKSFVKLHNKCALLVKDLSRWDSVGYSCSDFPTDQTLQQFYDVDA